MYELLNIQIPGQGNPNADIAIVGEAGGRDEAIQRKPFVGASGAMLNSILQKVGISRQECWITNVVKYTPPSNDFKSIPNLNLWRQYLYDELKAINPKIVIALGNQALEALTGNTGITSWRGSILHSKDINKRVIPTYHPAYLLRSESVIDRSVCEFDFKRALEEMDGRPLPQRNLVVIRDAGQLNNYLSRYEDKPILASDIETYKSVPICVGFAPSRSEAISVPLFRELWGQKFCDATDTDLALRWRMVDKLFRSKEIVGQNWKFDQGKLHQMGFRMPKFRADTMFMAHTRFPELPKGLAFLASIWTREPYYKLEGKEFHPKKDSPDRLFLYNAKDCAVEYEIFEVLEEQLRAFGVYDFYYTFVNHLHQMYLDIEREGILVDEEARQALRLKYECLFQENQAELELLCHGPVNVMSPKQVGQLLYGTLGLPQRQGTGEEVLVALQANFGEKKPHIVPIIDKILRGRTIRKTLGTYINACPDYDGRHRTSYQVVGTETGRTSTKTLKPPTRPEPIGLAFQTITKHSEMGKDILKMLVPDSGYVYLEPDLSQAEARIVDLLAEDYEGLAEYGVIDKHSKTARIVLNLADDYPISKKDPERFIGKTCRHAGGYDMGKHRAMLTINTDAKKYGVNVHVSEWKAGQLLERFHAANPKIRNVFHKEVQNALARNNRTLQNPFGRKRQFSARWGDSLFKEAYAFLPQSTVGDVIKRAMLYYRHVLGSDARIVMEKHDAIGCLVKATEVEAHARVLKTGLEMPIDFATCTIPRGVLVIPAEFELGEKNFKDLVDYKLPEVA